MTRPCECDRVRRGEPYVKGRDCNRCWLWHHNAAIRRAWGGAGAAAPVRVALPARPPCAFEGAVIDPCKTCGDKEGRHVRQCFEPTGVRDRCTRVRVGPAVQACDDCPDYRPEEVARG